MKKLIISIIAILLFLPSVAHAAMVSSISVEGLGEFDLSNGRTSWSKKLITSFDYAKVTVVTTDDTYTVTGDGKVPVQEGANVLNITVTDGKETENYTINLEIVPKVKSTDGNPETGAFAPVALLVTIAGVCYISFLIVNKENKFKKI